MKVKVLIVTDSPYMRTGMGVVHYNIGTQLLKRGYNVVSLGWSSSKTPGVVVPWKVYTTEQRDYYGAAMFDKVIREEVPDIVLTVGDIWTVSYVYNSDYRGLFKWVGYCAVDGLAHNGGLPPSWAQPMKDMDRLIAYTTYGQKAISETLKEKVSIIPHGVDLKTFYPLDDIRISEIKRKAGIPEDRTVFLVVARNQPRKNIPEIFKGWSTFKKSGNFTNAVLFPHMLFKDPAGWDLDEIIDICGIKDSVAYIEEFSRKANNAEVMPDSELNNLYNVADVIILLSGEGFGLPLVEAMACGKPIIALDHSACGELVRDRGELVKVKYYITGVHATERPYPDMDDFVEKLRKLYRDEDLRKKLGKKGNEFVQNLSWDRIGDMWHEELSKEMNAFHGRCEMERIA